MCDMCLDNVVEQMFANKSKVTVNGARSSLHECPRLIFEVWHINMIMVEVGNGN